MSADRLRRSFRFLSKPDQVASAVDDEIQHHLDATIEELVARGMTEADARREAERRFGDLGKHRRELLSLDGQAVRSRRRMERMRDFFADTRYAARGLLREPVFTLGVAVTLGLGVAANATMFGVIDRLLLRPPPHVRDDPRMTLLYLQTSERQGLYNRASTSFADFTNLRDRSNAFESIAAFWTTDASLGRGLGARRVRLGLVTGEFFTLLGPMPALGRFLGPADERTRSEAPAVISYDFWQSQFGGAPDVLGKALHTTSIPNTIVGVAPRGFLGPQTQRVDAWIPIAAGGPELLGSNWETTRNMYWIRMVARWKNDISATEASQRATAVHRAANREAGKEDSLATVVLASIVPARGSVGYVTGGSTRPAMNTSARIATWLAGVAVIVLLIVCANVANLLLSRAHNRRREIAVRLALGVRRGRLIRQLVTDSLLLSLVGGVLGIGLAAVGGSVMRKTLLPSAALDSGVIDGRVLVFSLLVCVVTALLAGLAPALAASSPDLTRALRSGAREGGGRKRHLQRGLLVMQVGLSIVLVAGAALFIRSLRNVSAMRLGFDADRVLVIDVEARSPGSSRSDTDLFWAAARDQAGTIPGVTSASIGTTTPFNSGWWGDVFLPGRDSLPELRDKGPFVNAVSNEFLQTMGTQIVQGRGLLEKDVDGAERVAVVNTVMARLLWPHERAVGKCIKVGADTSPCTTVVGVMENIIRGDFREEENAQFILPLAQNPGGSMRSLFVRTEGDPARITGLVRDRIQSLRPDLPFAEVRTLRTIIDPELRPWRLGATMFGIFGSLALIVAAIGLYSVIAYDVAQRRQELGVRIALGARATDILKLVLGHGLGMASVGALIGLVVTLLVAPRIESLLFGIGARDAVTYLVVTAFLLLTALVASLVPARRAARVAPSEALRSE